MRTAREMDMFAIKNGYAYKGKSALKHFEVIAKKLQIDEEVLISMSPKSVYNGLDRVMIGVSAVAFTNYRLIYGQKSWLMSNPMKVINLQHVSDVHKSATGFKYGMINIDSIKENIGITLSKKKLDSAFNDILEILEDYKLNKSTPVNNSISVADELLKFKELLDLGVISQDEFDTKKRQLLKL